MGPAPEKEQAVANVGTITVLNYDTGLAGAAITGNTARGMS